MVIFNVPSLKRISGHPGVLVIFSPVPLYERCISAEELSTKKQIAQFVLKTMIDAQRTGCCTGLHENKRLFGLWFR